MAFPTALAAKLSGATEHQLAYWRAQDILVPEVEHEHSPYLYSFRDVIALRTFAWLRNEHSLQQIRQSLSTAQLFDLVNHPSEYRFVGLGSSIGLEVAGSTVDVAQHPGQEVIGSMADVLGAFVTRQGTQVRPLASPHNSITVDAERLGGWPTIEGTRVPYNTIAQLLEDGSITADQVPHYYPTVSAAAARDAYDFSREVDGTPVAA